MPSSQPTTLPQDLEATLRSAAAKRGISNARFDVESGSAARDGYSSIVHRVTITDEDNPAGDAFSVICKTARPIFGSLMTKLYQIEAYVYDTVLPAMEDVAHMEDPLPWPRCVSASSRAVVVADLRPEGFAMADRSRQMDAEHCRLAVRECARLHGAGLALQHCRPEVFAAMRDTLNVNVWDSPELRNNMKPFNRAVQVVPDLLADSFPKDGEVYNRLKALLAALKEDSVALMGPVTGPGYTIIHNDLHVNNMMFQYDKTTGAVTGCRLIDFQMSLYGCPAVDLVTLLLVCTDKPMRDAHWHDLIRGYHEEVLNTLRAAGCPESVYPWTLLQEQLSIASAYGLGMTPVYHYGLYSDDEVVAEMREAMAKASEGIDCTMGLKVTPELKNRLAGLVQDMVDWGWLPSVEETERRMAAFSRLRKK